MQEKDPDRELIEEIQSGSELAFNALVRRHQEPICRIAYRMIGNMEEARDIAQDVFIHAHKIIPGWRFKAKFFTWLYQTTLNLCRSSKRKRRRISYYEHIPDNLELMESPSASSQMQKDEQINMIRSALDQLSERQYQVVILRVYEKLKIQETAIIMGCREGTVKALLSQAIQKLSIHVHKENYNGEMSA